MSIRDYVLPEDKVFFVLFDQMAATILQAAGSLETLTADLSTGEQHCKEIRRLEHEGDVITRQVYESLNHSLITPLEPDEIQRLAPALDDVLDHIDWVAHQLCSYDITDMNAVLKEFSRFIALSAREIQHGISLLRMNGHHQEIVPHSAEINRIWNLSSDLLSRAMIELFKSRDTVQIIKLKDIFESMEMVLERCNDVGHVLTDISRAHP